MDEYSFIYDNKHVALVTHYKKKNQYVAVIKYQDGTLDEVPAHTLQKKKYLSPSLFRQYNS